MGGGGGDCAKLGRGLDSNGWVRAGVLDAILVWDIYCAKQNPEPDTQSGSRVHKGLVDQAPQSTQEYNLDTEIEKWPLTQTLTYKMGSSTFAAMSQLKVTSTTSAFLPIISSTDRTNRKIFPLEL